MAHLGNLSINGGGALCGSSATLTVSRHVNRNGPLGLHHKLVDAAVNSKPANTAFKRPEPTMKNNSQHLASPEISRSLVSYL
jgi:hypothetical protein